MKIDTTKGKELLDHAQDIRALYANRDKMFDLYDNMFLMKWEDYPKDNNLKLTMSPDARNAVLGATRLMVSTDPIWHVPEEKERGNGSERKIEKAAGNMWNISGKIKGSPIHYDAVLSSLLYGECHIAVTSTADLLGYSKKTKHGVKRIERIERKTPYLFEVWNPRNGYAEFDSLGMSAYYRVVKITAREARARYGDMISNEKSDTTELDLGIFYDSDQYAIFVDDTCVHLEDHGLPFIPVSCTITDGSMMFEQPEDQRQPMLYSLLKSGLWSRQNLMLTVLYTMVFAIGANALFVHTAPLNNPDKKLVVDHSTAGGAVELEAGERFEVLLNKGVIDPSMMTALDIAENKSSESTIYRQALGEQLKGNPAFSTVAMLSQSGRLPLVSTQKRGGWGIASAMEIALNWYKENGKAHDAMGFEPREMPEDVQIEANLDVKLPQDKLQLANIAQILKNAKLADDEWIHQNIMNIEDTEGMKEKIWSQEASELLFQQFMQQMAQQQMMQAQQQTMPQQQVNAGAQMPEGQGQMVQGMPPQAAGMLPGEGQAAAPEGGAV